MDCPVQTYYLSFVQQSLDQSHSVQFSDCTQVSVQKHGLKQTFKLNQEKILPQVNWKNMLTSMINNALYIAPAYTGDIGVVFLSFFFAIML